MANINDFKAKLAGGGARANQFKVTMPFPGYSQVGGEIEELAFLCKTTQLPAMNIPSFTVPFRGRQLKMAGDRTFDVWTVTILNDTDFAIRNPMERWMNGMNAHSANTGLSTPIAYEADLLVEQLDRSGDTLKKYTFRGSYPQDMSPIDLNYGTNDEIERFTVTFAYQYFETDTTT